MTQRPPLHLFVSEPPSRQVQGALERLRDLPDVVHVAAMPDVHFADGVCVGVALATSRTLYPAAVGGDIGCGMMAIRFDGETDAVRSAAAVLLEDFDRAVPVLKHRGDVPPLPAHLADVELSTAALERLKHRDGRHQLGSLGRGNHFLELQEDEEGAAWLMVHSGSRAMGQAIRRHAESCSDVGRRMLPALDMEAEAGQAYLADLRWALEYAAENRRRLAGYAADVLARRCGLVADASTLIECHHNFVQWEDHDSGRWLVHRKGAIAAQQGTPGIIPGSMGDESFHVTGRGHDAALHSSSHGAGRALPRGEAARVISTRELLRQMRGVTFPEVRARHLRDEAPGAYKPIAKVMRAQRHLTRIVRRLHPVLSFKGA